MPTPPSNAPPPTLHIAIIPDGNRRWAKEKGLSAWKGHEKSAENFKNLVEWCGKNGRVGTLTFWCFSTENWKRDPKEVEKLMEILEKSLTKSRKELKKNHIRLLRSGRSDRLPPSLLRLIDEITQETTPDHKTTLHLALDYGGKDEVTRAINRIIDGHHADHGNNTDLGNQQKPLTEEKIRLHLDQPALPDIDLIIRTSGEQRTSNFFLWQSTYAEWIFTQTYFPDFGPEDLAQALAEYQQRKRRFGG